MVKIRAILCSFVIFVVSTVAAENVQLGAGTCVFSPHEIRRRQTTGGAFPESLYESLDPILQLSSSNFDDEVFHRGKPPKSHVVEFYLSWCGHCRNFAPIYVKFAEDVKNWNPLVEVAAINCALDYNKDICTVNRVEKVPYLKYFTRNVKGYDEARVIGAHHSAGQLRRELAQLLWQDYEEYHYPNWPQFDYLPSSTKTADVWATLPEETKYLVLIFERPSADNYTAVETILDFWPYAPRMVARRVNDDHPLIEELDIVDFPTLVITARGSDVPIYKSDLRKAMVSDILAKLTFDQASGNISLPILMLTTESPTQVEPTTPETLEARRSKYFVSETDLLMAVRYALRSEVPRISYIAGANFTNLTRFVEALKKYFPQSYDVRDTLKFLRMPQPERLPRSERARRLFADLFEFLVSKNSSDSPEAGPSVTASEWREKWNELEIRYGYPFPNDSSWQHCRGSNAKYRGYTCGLWSLFHALTVNAYLEDGFKVGFDPFGVLQAIKAYAGTFFGCTHCSEHFMEMVTKTLKMDDWVRYSSDVVMYLWRAHNTVNKRLSRDVTEDPAFPKYQFPPTFLCDRCHQGHYYERPNQTEWNYRSVLRYLLQYYTLIRPHQEASGGRLALH